VCCVNLKGLTPYATYIFLGHVPVLNEVLHPVITAKVHGSPVAGAAKCSLIVMESELIRTEIRIVRMRGVFGANDGCHEE
jgi:hypothetical protein